MDRATIQDQLGLKDRKSFVERYLKPELEADFIAMIILDKSNSRLQKYCFTYAYSKQNND